MDAYTIIKTVHIISSTILFGTGLGIAYFLFCSHYAQNNHEKYFAARFAVLADYIFTLPAVIIQPVSGLWLMWHGGHDPYAFWLQATYALYLLAGVCWLPVVWIQIQLKTMLHQSVTTGTALPKQYKRLYTIWFLLGIPAFAVVILIFYLMVAKPV